MKEEKVERFFVDKLRGGEYVNKNLVMCHLVAPQIIEKIMCFFVTNDYTQWVRGNIGFRQLRLIVITPF